MRNATLFAVPFLSLLLAGCGSSSSEDPSGGNPGSGGASSTPTGPEQTLRNTFTTDRITLQPGEEILEACQGFSFNNPNEELWVTGITIKSTPGMHHSDWIILPDGIYPPTGNPADLCSNFVDAERGQFTLFDGAVEGDVLFAQSTQSELEEQQFGDGVAMRVPPDSQLFVYYHLINTTGAAQDIGVDADIYTIETDEVDIKLKDFSGSNFQINVPPRVKSRFNTDCMFPEGFGGDFNIRFVLPHYHYYGTGMRFEVIGGPNDGQVLFDTTGSVGEPLAQVVDPPGSLAGAEGLRFACEFQNDTDDTIGWGAGANDEMCFFLLHTDSEYSWTSIAGNFTGATQEDLGVDADGIHQFVTSGCSILATDLL